MHGIDRRPNFFEVNATKKKNTRCIDFVSAHAWSLCDADSHMKRHTQIELKTVELAKLFTTDLAPAKKNSQNRRHSLRSRTLDARPLLPNGECTHWDDAPRERTTKHEWMGRGVGIEVNQDNNRLQLSVIFQSIIKLTIIYCGLGVRAPRDHLKFTRCDVKVSKAATQQNGVNLTK